MALSHVLSVASEIFPVIKTGGLADVAGALPRAAAGFGVKMASLLPAYPSIKNQLHDLHALGKVSYGGLELNILYGRYEPGALELYLVDCEALYNRSGGIYADETGQDWNDNPKRFGALSYAAARIASSSLAPGLSFDVVHAHDWQTGLTPYYLKKAGRKAPPCVFTIHNIAFQGQAEPAWIKQLLLAPEDFHVDGYEYFGDIGFLKAGLFYADAITTVSPTYAREIQSEQFGMGLEGLLRTRQKNLSGIINGIDETIWNPATDSMLKSNFTSSSLDKRQHNKEFLLNLFGLEADINPPLFAVVSRLTWQKGMDLLLECLVPFVEAGGRFVMLGSGDKDIEKGYLGLARRYPQSVGVKLGYDEAISHQIQGGADAILIPSRFEPCGLTQLYGLRYGCVPVVTRLGGLADTVIEANDIALRQRVATGLQFYPASAAPLAQAIERAWKLYEDRSAWRMMQLNGMKQDLSWNYPASMYIKIYEQLLTHQVT